MNTIRFENDEEITVSQQQKDAMVRYYKTILVAGVPKLKELINNGIVIRVVFYKKLETKEEIFNLFPKVNSFDIRERKTINDYIEETERSYLNKELKLLSVYIFDKYANIIYSDSRDILTKKIVKGQVLKYYLIDNDPLKEITFDYNGGGSLESVLDDHQYMHRSDDMTFLFGEEWKKMTYYHKATPIIPK